MDKPKNGQSLRSILNDVWHGRYANHYRIRFDDEWSKSKPYAVFVNGSAIASFYFLFQAIAKCEEHANKKLIWQNNWS